MKVRTVRMLLSVQENVANNTARSAQHVDLVLQ